MAKKQKKQTGNGVWLQEQGKTRRCTLELELARFNGGLHEEDRANKYGRMAESPFAFYRGSAHLFYRDLAVGKMIAGSLFNRADTTTWVMGDLHVGNFGAFCDAEEDIVFDLNDFDEAWVASYLFDIWRCAASLILAGRDIGYLDRDLEKAVTAFAEEYLEELEQARGKHGRGVDKVTSDRVHGPLRRFLEKAEKRKSRPDMLEQWTYTEGNERRFRMDDDDLETVTDDDMGLLKRAVSLYKDQLDSDLRGRDKYFKVQDAAKRLNAGVGSLGTPRYYVLIRGKNDDPDTCRILDVKQQGMPSFFQWLPCDERARLRSWYDDHRAGARVIHAQKALLLDADKHLGSISILGRSFSIRERSPYKKSLNLARLEEFRDFKEMAHHWGTITAAAHARADKDYKTDLIDHDFESVVTNMVAGESAGFIREINNFAFSYADQVLHDHALFLEMRAEGLIE